MIAHDELTGAGVSWERIRQPAAEPGALQSNGPAAAGADLRGCAQPALAAHANVRAAHHAGHAAPHFQRLAGP